MATAALLCLMATAAAGSDAPSATHESVRRFDQALALAADSRADEAMDALRAAIDAGYQDWFALRGAPALAPLRTRGDWPDLEAGFRARNPWVAVISRDDDDLWRAYAAGALALRDGSGPVQERLSSPAVAGVFGQLQSQYAALFGDYDFAHANYFGGIGRVDAASAGIVRLRPALPDLAALVEGRQVVMLNENHGHSNQRAANFLFVRELRRLGFTHLALETLAHEPTAGDACRSTVAQDAALQARGYAVEDTGFYTRDPIYAELVRMAIAEGYTLVAYERTFEDPASPQREEAQARNIACVLQEEPDARIVVIGGGGHTSKAEGGRAGGVMGRRLSGMLEVEPLSITNVPILVTGLSSADAPAGYTEPSADGVMAGQPWFADGADGPVTRAGYDRSAYLPAPAARSPEAGWLRLGGWRVPAPPVGTRCGQPPCLLEARRVGEAEEAVPGDRCVTWQAERGCTLFLAPGRYRLDWRDATGEGRGTATLLVPAES